MENDDVNRYVQENVRALRTERGWRLADLSERLQAAGRPMAISTLSKLERGERSVDAADLVALTEALEVPISRLIIDPELADQNAVNKLLNDWTQSYRERNQAIRGLEVTTAFIGELPIADATRERVRAWTADFFENYDFDAAALRLFEALDMEPPTKPKRGKGKN